MKNLTWSTFIEALLDECSVPQDLKIALATQLTGAHTRLTRLKSFVDDAYGFSDRLNVNLTRKLDLTQDLFTASDLIQADVVGDVYDLAMIRLQATRPQLRLVEC